jgi:CheY-like chemotaxis protein
MSGDLLTLRMMVVAAENAVHQQWRQAAGLASVPIEFSAENADGAITPPRPANANEARDLVERCIRMRLPKRVLVVDDSGTMRSIVRKILSGSRFALEVSEAAAGEDALKQLADGFDLVLLDCNMPGIDGFETLAQIRQIAPRVDVVMMTGTEDEAAAGRARASGAAAFIKKPFYPADIDAVIVTIYGGRI